MVRTNLEFMTNEEKKCKLIMLTSFNPGSGKTFICANLGASFAIRGSRVICIDLDLRRGSLSEFAGKPKKGLTNYLSGQEENYEDLIVHQPFDEQNEDKTAKVLDILPMGKLPPNPTELLYSPKLKPMLDELRRHYDYIFVDCPPVEIVADATIISREVDVSIFVIRAGLLERSMLPSCRRTMTRRNIITWPCCSTAPMPSTTTATTVMATAMAATATESGMATATMAAVAKARPTAIAFSNHGVRNLRTNMSKDIITVTSPLLPSLDEFNEMLKKIWASKWITNNGDFHKQLEKALAEYLKVPYISLFTNGTLPLLTALQALRITGEVITTPYSFVATTHSIWWNGCKPVFVDIEEETCGIDPDKIEAAITPKTTAIMPVHCYGQPVKMQQIQEIADKYGLKVIYDAAHAFGVEVDGESV